MDEARGACTRSRGLTLTYKHIRTKHMILRQGDASRIHLQLYPDAHKHLELRQGDASRIHLQLYPDAHKHLELKAGQC
jgi:hypothetical protein